MKNGGIDKRVIKTKNAIFEAFKQLVQEKDMSDITISELTQKANITRSTFYMYYDTVGDVRSDIENGIIAGIDKIMSETDILNSIKNPYPLLSMLADEILKQDATTDTFFRPARRVNFSTKSTTESSVHICTGFLRTRGRRRTWAKPNTSWLLRRPV